MALSKFRQRLQNSEINFEKKALLKREYDRFRPTGQKASRGLSLVADVLLGLLMLLWLLWKLDIVKTSLTSSLAVMFLGICCVCLGQYLKENRNPANFSDDSKYDFEQQIMNPTLSLFDEKLTGHFHADPYNLVDTYMSYPDALVEAHMVRTGMTNAKYLGKCSYDWSNPLNTDSFEFLCCETCYPYVYADKKGNQSRDICIFKFHTSFKVKGIVHIMSTKTEMIFGTIAMETTSFKPIKNKKVVGINTENHIFDEYFDVLATYDEDAYQYLTPLMMETLLALRQRYCFSICIKGNVMTVAVDNNESQFANLTNFQTEKLVDTRSRTLDQHIESYRHILLSIYELKDRLDPGGRDSMN